MKPILAIAQPDGSLDMGEYNRASMRQFIKDNAGRRVRLVLSLQVPESKKQRAFYHSAILPLIAYFQEDMDFRNPDDIDRVHDWLKIALNGEFIEIRGKAVKVGKTTRGELAVFIERVIEWMSEQGYPVELLNPEGYKQWDTQVFPFGGPETYLEYLISVGRLLTPESYT